MKSRNRMKRQARFEALEGRLTLSAIPGVPCPAAVAAAAHQASEAVVAKPLTNSVAKSVAKAAPIENTSSNWSGYAISGAAGSVSDVAGTWTVPTVNTATSGYSAVWVGIDGYSSSSVEQIGTEEDVSGGRASYSAWYEMYPAGSVTITTMTVKPGDSMTGSVAYSATNKDFVLTLTDTTESTATSPDSFSITLSASGVQRSSAEWIVEAPSSGYGILPLANFGTAAFTDCYATIGGTTGAIDAWQSYAISIASRGSSQDSTSALTDTGNTSAFTVTYGGSGSVTPTPTPPTPTTPTTPQPHRHWGWGGGWGGWGGGWSSDGGGWGWDSVDVTSQGVAGHGRGSSQLSASPQALRDHLFASPEAFIT
jgi:hypothetical protein